MPAVPTGSSCSSHLVFGSCQDLTVQKAARDCGGGPGWVSIASHFFCVLELASRIADPPSPGTPHVSAHSP